MNITYISLASCDLITFIDFAVVRSERAIAKLQVMVKQE
jgi:hypothetical protein